MALAVARGQRATFCPSDVARVVAAEWRPVMPTVRAVAGELVAAGRIVATQKGVPVDPVTALGAIRLRLV